VRIGINASGLLTTGASLEELCEHAGKADAEGFHSYWLGQLAIPDSLTVIAVMGGHTSRIELGTAVVPTWARHPLMLAAQALTVQEATRNRLALGVGVGHRDLIEPALKVRYRKLGQHMTEYLAVLAPALRQRSVSSTGEFWSGEDDLSGAALGAVAPPVILAAMGPRMLSLAGSTADGVILWLAGPRTIAETIRPPLEAAADAASRPAPRVIAGLPVCVTDDARRVGAIIDHVLGPFTRFDSYREVLSREGATRPSEVALVGTEAEVRDGLDALADAGASDFAATEFVTNNAEADATRATLAAANASAPVAGAA
jgi:F420-dependent oxidoreductase-like protein